MDAGWRSLPSEILLLSAVVREEQGTLVVQQVTEMGLINGIVHTSPLDHAPHQAHVKELCHVVVDGVPGQAKDQS